MAYLFLTRHENQRHVYRRERWQYSLGQSLLEGVGKEDLLAYSIHSGQYDHLVRVTKFEGMFTRGRRGEGKTPCEHGVCSTKMVAEWWGGQTRMTKHRGRFAARRQTHARTVGYLLFDIFRYNTYNSGFPAYRIIGEKIETEWSIVEYKLHIHMLCLADHNNCTRAATFARGVI